MPSSNWQPPGPSVLDGRKWPEKLVAKAVQCEGSEVRVHGYSLLGDLARHFNHADVVYVAIVGEEPTADQAARFDLALTSLCATPINEGAVHLGVLSRMCGGSLASALSAAAICAADTSRLIAADHVELVRWLELSEGAPPAQFVAESSDDEAFSEALRAALEARGVPAGKRPPLRRRAGQIALIHDSGVRAPERIEAALTFGLWSGLLAEVLVAQPKDLPRYPMQMPPFRYVEGAADER